MLGEESVTLVLMTHGHGSRCQLLAREFGRAEAQLAGQSLDGVTEEDPSLHGRCMAGGNEL